MAPDKRRAWIARVGAALSALLAACAVDARTPVCGGCRVDVEHVVTLGSESDSVLTTIIPSMARSPNGTYYVAEVTSPGVVAMYDSTGRLRGTFGRLGQGPGEFSTALTLAAMEGSLQVLDRVRQILSVFDDSARLVGSTSLPYPVTAQVRLSETLTVVHPTPRPGIRAPGYVVVRTNRVTVELPLTNPEEPLIDKHWRGLRLLAPAEGSETRFWSAPMNRYEIELWDADSGMVIQTIVPEPGFEPWDEWAPGVPMRAPAPPAVVGLWHQDGYLMTLIAQADANWNPAESNESLDVTPEWQSKYLDTRIDVIDPAKGTVIASTLDDRLLQVISGAPLLYTVVETPGGEYLIEVLRVTLTRPVE